MIIDESNYGDYMSDDNILNCHNSNITEIRYLPEGLIRLNCYNNKLISLPELPKELTQLYCFNNKLTSLPELPETLELLDCDYNQLTSLPKLPKGLEQLYCRGNEELPYCDIYNNKKEIKTFIKKLRTKEKLKIFLS